MCFLGRNLEVIVQAKVVATFLLFKVKTQPSNKTLRYSATNFCIDSECFRHKWRERESKKERESKSERERESKS